MISFFVGSSASECQELADNDYGDQQGYHGNVLGGIGDGDVGVDRFGVQVQVEEVGQLAAECAEIADREGGASAEFPLDLKVELVDHGVLQVLVEEVGARC